MSCEWVWFGWEFACTTIILENIVQPHLQGTHPPQVDFSTVALSTWIVHRHPSASLGQCDGLAAARDFLFVCVFAYLCGCMRLHLFACVHICGGVLFVYACVHVVCMCTCVCVHMCAYMPVSVSACMCVCVNHLFPQLLPGTHWWYSWVGCFPSSPQIPQLIAG